MSLLVGVFYVANFSFIEIDDAFTCFLEGQTLATRARLGGLRPLVAKRIIS
jgi:hypothetical protein